MLSLCKCHHVCTYMAKIHSNCSLDIGDRCERHTTFVVEHEDFAFFEFISIESVQSKFEILSVSYDHTFSRESFLVGCRKVERLRTDCLQTFVCADDDAVCSVQSILVLIEFVGLAWKIFTVFLPLICVDGFYDITNSYYVVDFRMYEFFAESYVDAELLHLVSVKIVYCHLG